ncbi:SRPBCC domain-containing protein [Nocardioides panacisoli]|uniref:SRPBCC family protein n=1 Tax=Nocardioides panacisoli TaxID=627624 RepID=A0ABP7IVM8_9ACTN
MSNAARELRAEVVVDAPAERIWEVITDTRALAEASPELLTMMPLRRGGFRKGQQYVGWNRRKLVVWPTRSVVVEADPPHRLAWDTRSSGARWIFEIEPADSGTRLVQRRPVPNKLTGLSKAFAAVLLGGGEGHADELEQGMATSLERLKAIAEKR